MMDDTERTALAASYANVNAKIEPLEEVKEMIRERLLEEGTGTRMAGNLKVSVTPNRRIDPEAMAREFPVEDYPELYKPTVNTDAVKELSAEAQERVYRVVGMIVKVINP